MEASKFPLDIFPEELQGFIKELKRTNNFAEEFTAMGILYVVGLAIGNTMHVQAKKMWNKLKGGSPHIDLEESTDIKVRVRSKCITTFQKIDYFGYHTDINWILSLSISRLRMLFRSLASYWNYKAGFTQELKNRIYPHGVLFTDTEFREGATVVRNNVMSDYSNIEYNFATYSQINDVGKHQLNTI